MLFGSVAIAVAVAQDVQVTSAKNALVLSVSAQTPYDLVSGEKKTPVLGVQCVKGKEAGHVVTFSPGVNVIENNPKGNQATFMVTISVEARDKLD